MLFPEKFRESRLLKISVSQEILEILLPGKSRAIRFTRNIGKTVSQAIYFIFIGFPEADFAKNVWHIHIYNFIMEDWNRSQLKNHSKILVGRVKPKPKTIKLAVPCSASQLSSPSNWTHYIFLIKVRA